ncbi:MAG TPA: response regulator transcription factor [Cycloclasticus sp.]|jgi:two-component system response regulator RegA|nr:response regulator transcription factor [Cycloclasticus sp.]HIL92621.1 response regulator transcription factor [Cycloclasticus sp.]
MEDNQQRILIIDDDEIYCSVLCDAFTRRGFDVAFACDEQQAIEQIERFEPELAVVDLRLEQSSGLHLIKRLKDNDENTKIIMLTGYASIATAVQAVKLGAIQYLTKPANADEILAALGQSNADVDVEPSQQPLSVKRLEWEHMQKILLECEGNISEAARRLNMHRRTLQRKLAKRPVRQ